MDENCCLMDSHNKCTCKQLRPIAYGNLLGTYNHSGFLTLFLFHFVNEPLRYLVS